MPVLEGQWSRFLAELSLGRAVETACDVAEIGVSTAYRRRKEDGAFATLWDEARAEGHAVLLDRLEAEADRRARDGWDEPVFHDGAQCGSKRRYSDTLLIFRLKALAPQRYRDNQDVTVSGPGGGPVEHVYRWADPPDDAAG